MGRDFRCLILWFSKFRAQAWLFKYVAGRKKLNKNKKTRFLENKMPKAGRACSVPFCKGVGSNRFPNDELAKLYSDFYVRMRYFVLFTLTLTAKHSWYAPQYTPSVMSPTFPIDYKDNSFPK